MKVIGSKHVDNVINLILNKVGKATNSLPTTPIIPTSSNNSNVGVEVDENPKIATLVSKFESVPEKPELNVGQRNLVLTGAIMGGTCEETAEI